MQFNRRIKHIPTSFFHQHAQCMHEDCVDIGRNGIKFANAASSFRVKIDQTKMSVKFHIFLQKAFNNHFNTTYILHIEKYSRKVIHIYGMLPSLKMDTWNITYKYTFHTLYFKVQILVARKTLFWCQTAGSTSVGNGSSVTMVAWL